MNIHNELRVWRCTIKRDYTANMTRIREDQVQGETLDTIQLMLKIGVTIPNILTFIV